MKLSIKQLKQLYSEIRSVEAPIQQWRQQPALLELLRATLADNTLERLGIPSELHPNKHFHRISISLIITNAIQVIDEQVQQGHLEQQQRMIVDDILEEVVEKINADLKATNEAGEQEKAKKEDLEKEEEEEEKEKEKEKKGAEDSNKDGSPAPNPRPKLKRLREINFVADAPNRENNQQYQHQQQRQRSYARPEPNQRQQQRPARPEPNQHQQQRPRPYARPEPNQHQQQRPRPYARPEPNQHQQQRPRPYARPESNQRQQPRPRPDVRPEPRPSVDLYQMLGISRTATPKQIRRAYYRQALKNHPDKFIRQSKEVQDQQTEKFKLISKAYDTLRDPQSRSQYDRASPAAGLNNPSPSANNYASPAA